jgi:hypothetical protein
MANFDFSTQEILNRVFDPTNNRLDVFPRIGDDEVLSVGAGGDGAIVLRSTTLAADTALANVLIGTPVTEALAANSLIISNITASGDMLFAVRRGGNSEAVLWADASAGVTYLYGLNGGITLGLAADAPAPDNSEVLIFKGSSGGTGSAESLLTLEHSGGVKLGLLGGSGSNIGIHFGDSEAENAGVFQYAQDDTQFEFFIETVKRLTYGANAFAFQEATTISTVTGNLSINVAGNLDWIFQSGFMTSNNSAGLRISDIAASATTPVFMPDQTDTNTGIGQAGADQLSLISGGVEVIRLNTTSAVLAASVELHMSNTGGYVVFAITDTDSATEAAIWYSAADNKLEFFNGSAKEAITSSGFLWQAYENPTIFRQMYSPSFHGGVNPDVFVANGAWTTKERIPGLLLDEYEWFVGDKAIMVVESFMSSGAVHALPYPLEQALQETQWVASVEERLDAVLEANQILRQEKTELEAALGR